MVIFPPQIGIRFTPGLSLCARSRAHSMQTPARFGAVPRAVSVTVSEGAIRCL